MKQNVNIPHPSSLVPSCCHLSQRKLLTPQITLASFWTSSKWSPVVYTPLLVSLPRHYVYGCVHVMQVAAACSFLFTVQLPWCECATGGCLLRSAWTLGCFHLETIIIRAAMNILAYVFLLVTIWAHFCWVYPRCGNSGPWSMHMARFSRSYYLSKVVVLIYIFTKSVWKLWFLHLLTTPYQYFTTPLLPLPCPCTAMQAGAKHSVNL